MKLFFRILLQLAIVLLAYGAGTIYVSPPNATGLKLTDIQSSFIVVALVTMVVVSFFTKRFIVLVVVIATLVALIVGPVVSVKHSLERSRRERMKSNMF